MNDLGLRIKACKTPDELNSLRMLIVKDIANFQENQILFKKRMAKFKRVPLINRPSNWGELYNPKIKQQEK